MRSSLQTGYTSVCVGTALSMLWACVHVCMCIFVVDYQWVPEDNGVWNSCLYECLDVSMYLYVVHSDVTFAISPLLEILRSHAQIESIGELQRSSCGWRSMSPQRRTRANTPSTSLMATMGSKECWILQDKVGYLNSCVYQVCKGNARGPGWPHSHYAVHV